MSVLRTILAVVLGLFIGSIVNMALIMLGSEVISAPPGVDVTTAEGLKAGMAQMEPRHFLFPWLAHAAGTLVGALLACWISKDHRKLAAYIIGFAFLLGGVANVLMLPSPWWFTLVDLSLAYLPMAWLALRLRSKILSK